MLKKDNLNELLLDTLPHPAILIRKDRTILVANRIARELGAKIGGLCWRDFGQSEYIPDNDKKYINDHQKVPPRGTACHFCLADEALTKQKTMNNPRINAWNKICDICWIPLDNEMLLHYTIDVTERIRIDDKLRESEKRYREMFNRMSSGVAVYKPIDDGRDFIFVDFNPAGELMDQTSRDHVIGKRVTEVFPGVWKFGLLEVFQRVWRTGKPENHPVSFYEDNRINGWRENLVYPLSSGEIVAICKDVTSQKQAEQILQRSEERYRLLADNAHDVIWTCDLNLNSTYYSPSIERLTGYTSEEAIAIPNIDRMTSPSFELISNTLKEEMVCEKRGDSDPQRNTTLEIELFRKDGSTVWIETIVKFLRDDKGIAFGILGISRDISNRKRAAAELERTRAELDQIFNAAVSLCVIDKNHTVIRANTTFCKDFDVHRDEIIGKKCFDVLDHQLCRTTDCPMSMILEGKERHECEMSLDTGDDSPTIFKVTAHPFKNSRNELIGIVENFTDITDRYQAEQEIIRSLREKEVLLKEVHHRVNNNLQIIHSLLNLQANGIEDDFTRDKFKQSQERIRTMAQIHDMLYSSDDLATIDLGEFIRVQANRLLSSYCLDSTMIDLRLDNENVSVEIGRALPCGLIVNELLTNTLKHAFPSNREEMNIIEISLHALTGSEIELTIRDNGIGLPQNFDLNQTKSFGFHIVTVLVRQLRGDITIDSSNGTTFQIKFSND